MLKNVEICIFCLLLLLFVGENKASSYYTVDYDGPDRGVDRGNGLAPQESLEIRQDVR